jgi:hypothetical protein
MADAAGDAGEKPDVTVDAVAMCGPIACDCTFKGKNLFGGVRYVDRGFPHDVKVRVVTSPHNCGRATTPWSASAF